MHDPGFVQSLVSITRLPRFAKLDSVRPLPVIYRRDVTRTDAAKRVREWLERVGVKTLYIEPGSPWENGYVESFARKRRDVLLDREVFDTLLDAKVLIGRWRKAYNAVRPHSSLGAVPRPRSRAAPVRTVRLRLTKRTEAIPWQAYPGDRHWFHSWG